MRAWMGSAVAAVALLTGVVLASGPALAQTRSGIALTEAAPATDFSARRRQHIRRHPVRSPRGWRARPDRSRYIARPVTYRPYGYDGRYDIPAFFPFGLGYGFGFDRW